MRLACSVVTESVDVVIDIQLHHSGKENGVNFFCPTIFLCAVSETPDFSYYKVCHFAILKNDDADKLVQW